MKLKQIDEGVSLINRTALQDKWKMGRYLFKRFSQGLFTKNLVQEEISIRLSGLKVSFNTNSAQLGAYYDIFIKHYYEKLLNFSPQQGWTIIDAGANIGFYSLRSAKDVGPGGHIYAFEPYYDTYNLLKKNIEQNGFSWVDCLPMALASIEGKLAFQASPKETSTAQLLYKSIESPPELYNHNENDVAVDSTTLDSFVSLKKIKKIDLLKMDTEGAEADIIKGGTKFALNITQRVVMESHNTRYLVRDLLVPLGFEMVLDDRPRHIVYFEKPHVFDKS